MRLAAFALPALIAIGAIDARAADPYEVFRLGMSVAEFKQAVEENGGEAFDPIERGARERNETPEDLGPYRIFLGGVPAEDEAMGTFIFKDGTLKIATFEYEFLPHTTPEGWKTASECEAMFARIGRQIETVYGASTGFAGPIEDSDGSVTRAWHLPDATVDLYMYIDATAGQLLPGSLEGDQTSYCGSLRATAFDGNEKERDLFGSEMEAFGARQQDRR